MTTATLTTTTMSITGGGCSGGTVQNSDASYTASVPSGGSLVLPNSDIEVNGILEGQVVSVKTTDIQITDGIGVVTPTSVAVLGNTVSIEVPASVNISTATQIKTGQTISYRTGDDGDIEAGRSVNFTTLAENNPFGNTNRFTSELGTQTYTNNIVIDWSTFNGSTVFGWRRTITTGKTWNQAIDECLLVSIGTFATGWRLPNIREIMNIFPFANITVPYSFGNFVSSTTFEPISTYCYQFFGDGRIFYVIKIGSYDYIPCRTFTVTGTTLS